MWSNRCNWSDSANTLGTHVNLWRHDQRDAEAYKSMGEENELPKNSPKLELRMEHGSKKSAQTLQNPHQEEIEINHRNLAKLI